MAKVEGDFGHPELVSGQATELHYHPKEFWAEMVDPNLLYYSNVGQYTVLELWVGDGVSFKFHLPEDFANLVWAKLIMIPDATETVEAGFLIAASAAGEAYDFNEKTTWGETLAVTKDALTEWNITSLFPSMVAGDYVGITIYSDTSMLRIVGLVVRYS